MKIISLDEMQNNQYFGGWNYVRYYIQNFINTDTVCIVDYMDKYFNLFFDTKKDVYVNGKHYVFYVRDTYYNIDDPQKSDSFISYENEVPVIIRWYQEYNEFKIARGHIVSKYVKKYNILSRIECDWIGILHYPDFEGMSYSSLESFVNIRKSRHFQESFSRCRGIITLSNHLKNEIQNISPYNQVPIHVLMHPINFSNIRYFDMSNYRANQKKMVVQLGFWMRRMCVIQDINACYYQKMWLPGGKYWRDMYRIMYPNRDIPEGCSRCYYESCECGVKMPGFLSDTEYDKILSENIGLLFVYNSSANNSVLECLIRNTPCIIQRHPAIEEYLGVNYPMFVLDEQEAECLLKSQNIDSIIEKTHMYLKNLNKKVFHIEHFISNMREIIKS